MTAPSSGHDDRDWPGPEAPDPSRADLPVLGELTPVPPRRRTLWWLVSVLVTAVAAGVVGYHMGGSHALRDQKAQAEASASAAARLLPPTDLYCPDSNSDDGRRAIRDQAVVTIDEPPAQRVVVMRKAAVVVVKADLAGDLVVCGNDARVAFITSPRPSARVLVQGGTDSKIRGSGPMVFEVDAAKVNPARVWFTNGNPQIVNCSSLPNTKVRSCASYYAITPPSPSPSATR